MASANFDNVGITAPTGGNGGVTDPTSGRKAIFDNVGPTIPGTPGNVTVTVTGATTADVNWADAGGGVTSYLVTVTTAGDANAGLFAQTFTQTFSSTVSFSFPSDSLAGHIVGLTPNGQYSLVVQALNPFGTGPSSAPVLFRMPNGSPSDTAPGGGGGNVGAGGSNIPPGTVPPQAPPPAPPPVFSAFPAGAAFRPTNFMATVANNG